MTALLKENSQDEIPSVDATDTPRETVPATSPVAARSEVQIDNTGTMLCYANFCRVTGTPEELILDFGLNAQSMGAPTNIEIKQRLVVNYFTAKRLFQALGMSNQRHETAFGVLETDVQKRVTPSLRRASAPA